MKPNAFLCLVLHNHQPIGNFDGVFEQAVAAHGVRGQCNDGQIDQAEQLLQHEARTLAVLNGFDGVPQLISTDGLRLEVDGCIVRGLSIVGFKGSSGDGIDVRSAGNTIEGNFIGTTAAGRYDAPAGAIQRNRSM